MKMALLMTFINDWIDLSLVHVPTAPQLLCE